MDLLERDAQRDALRNVLDRVRQGHGCTVLVSGEVGVGKTVFVTDFVTSFRTASLVLWGSCDPLYTPRPLGALYDIALQKMPNLLDLLNSNANWHAVALELFMSLQDTSNATIIVFEDIHWADEATLDLLKFLGRRVAQTHTLMILTYRDDEVVSQGTLLETLGNFPSEATLRLPLEPLSEKAVALLAAGAKRSPEGIYLATRGNPFFVTEVLRSRDERIPKTVRDAVLARAGHLLPAARKILELVAIMPGPVEPWLLDSILQPEPAAIDACIRGGFLVPSGHALSFRHELARLAIEESIPFSQSKLLHQKVLLALQERNTGIPLALLVHHAVGAAAE